MTPTVAVLLVLLGIVLGAYGTLIGSGGGFLLTPILLLLYPQESPEVITSISLTVVFFNALSGSIAFARMKRIDFSAGKAFALATVPGAVAGALTTRLLPRNTFEVLFGLVLVAVAVYIALRRVMEGSTAGEGRPGWTTHVLTDAFGHEYRYSFNRNLGLAVSFAVGFISSLLGIGGGVIHVPALVQVLNFPPYIAAATSQFVLVITALTGSLVHIGAGDFHSGYRRTLFLGIGVIVGAQIGARLAGRVRGGTIVRLLAIALAAVGIRLVLHGAGIV